jgi:alcohol dehydrogenase, propanol-preferring
MKACVLKAPAVIETNPLAYMDVPAPEPATGEVLVRVKYCGVCRTDLHVVEGELELKKSPVIPGHQVVGVVEKLGALGETTRPAAAAVSKISVGSRVGIAWLHHTDGTCSYCLADAENLCDNPSFTGYTVDGGYAEYIVAPADFVYPIPERFPDEQAAPLLCAGIIGFRCLRQSGIKPGGKLGFYGFGAAAHVAIQVASHWKIDVFAATRDSRHQKLAMELGAIWAGGTLAEPPVQLDAAIVFAPAGEIVPAALRALRKGGTLVLGGIYMSAIPPLEYQWLYGERVIRSVANNTRQDGHDFLRVAAEIPVRTRVRLYPLSDANRALNALKNDPIPGAAVLQVG